MLYQQFPEISERWTCCISNFLKYQNVEHAVAAFPCDIAQCDKQMNHIACLKTGLFHGAWKSEKLHRGVYQHGQVHHTANVYILVNANNHWVLALFFPSCLSSVWIATPPGAVPYFAVPLSVDPFVSGRDDSFESGSYTTTWKSFTRHNFVPGHFALSSIGRLRCQDGRCINRIFFISMDNEDTTFDVRTNVAENLKVWIVQEGQQRIIRRRNRKSRCGA